MTNLCAQTGLPRDFDTEKKSYEQRWETIRKAAISSKENELHRIMAQNELESDEFFTAKQKAKAYRDRKIKLLRSG